jgi:hypothetical protein
MRAITCAEAIDDIYIFDDDMIRAAAGCSIYERYCCKRFGFLMPARWLRWQALRTIFSRRRLLRLTAPLPIYAKSGVLMLYFSIRLPAPTAA